jgi:hypothetical protein
MIADIGPDVENAASPRYEVAVIFELLPFVEIAGKNVALDLVQGIIKRKADLASRSLDPGPKDGVGDQIIIKAGHCACSF